MMNEGIVNDTAACTGCAPDEEDTDGHACETDYAPSMLSVHVPAEHETESTEQDTSAEALAKDLESFLWPQGTKGQGCLKGKSWANLDIATEEIEHFMRAQGCLTVKVKNQTYFDDARTRVKKRVFKCPCAGMYKPRAMDKIAVDGIARQTTTKKSDCGVYINVNVDSQTAEACVTTSSHLHNHNLHAPVSAVTQQFDGELVSSIERWAQCGLATKVIRQLVQLELGVPFLTLETKKKIANLVQKVTDAKLDPLDAHKFIQSVAEQHGAFLEYTLDTQGCLEAMVWALPEQVEAIRLYGDVWVQDNTCKTLSANRPFFAIVGVDGNSKTRLLVQGVLKDESAEQFIWALGAVQKLCQDRSPQSIFTDADIAAELALNKLFPTSGKYRCFWHLSQNLTKKLKKTMGAGPFQELLRHFQAAVYATTETLMRSSWELVMQCARSSDVSRGIQSNDGSSSAVKYMQHILLDERRWAYWYRTGRFTLGIASTQRCEGFFGKLKLQLGSISSLQHLGSTVHSISTCDSLESRLLTEALALRTSTRLLPGFDRAWGAILDAAKSCGTQFLHQHMAAETAAAAQYVVHEHARCTQMDAARCACFPQSDVTAGAALAPSDPEGVERDLVRTDSLSDVHDETTRVFSVHYHTAYTSGTSTQHLVRVGMQAGVHMCSCLQLAHRGLPCRHYFAVLLHDQSLQFDVDVIPPRWITHPTRSLPPPCADTPKLYSPKVYSPACAERMKVVQYLSMDVIKHNIELLSGDVRGLKSKAEYAERLVALEFDVSRKSQATLLTTAAQAVQLTVTSSNAGQHNSSADGDFMDVVNRQVEDILDSPFTASLRYLNTLEASCNAQNRVASIKTRHEVIRQRIYIDSLASCKSLVSMLAQHGSEHDAQEAMVMFEAFVKLRVTKADGRIGNLVPNVRVQGIAVGQRMKSAVEVERTKAKRQKIVIRAAV